MAADSTGMMPSMETAANGPFINSTFCSSPSFCVYPKAMDVWNVLPDLQPCYSPEPWLLPGCSSVYDSLVNTASPTPSIPAMTTLQGEKGRFSATNKPRRSSILERCILKVSTSSACVGTDDMDSMNRPPLSRWYPRSTR